MQTFAIDESLIETAPCHLCGTIDAERIAALRVAGGPEFFTTDCCRACGLLYRATRPKLDWFLRSWNGRAAHQAATGFSPFNPAIEATRYQRYSYAAHALTTLRATGRILDVASGPATGIKAYLDAGLDPTGLEPDSTRARYLDVPGVRMLETTIEEYAASGERYDCASLIHCLEHFHDPLATLRMVAGLVRDGGLIYVEVPDCRQFVVDWNDALTIVHLTNFTRETLVAMGQAAGLGVAGVAFPAADPPARTHLGIVFHSTGLNVPCTYRADSRPWQNVYRRGLPPGDGPLVLEVPSINDLSLCYKRDPARIEAAVHGNFNREATLVDGVYRIT